MCYRTAIGDLKKYKNLIIDANFSCTLATVKVTHALNN